MEKLISKFKNEHLNSRDEFEGWLLAITSKKIQLKDLGSDMQVIYIHESGEILHTDFFSGMYNGRFINIEKLEVGKPIELYDEEKNEFIAYGGLIPEEII